MTLMRHALLVLALAGCGHAAASHFMVELERSGRVTSTDGAFLTRRVEGTDSIPMPMPYRTMKAEGVGVVMLDYCVSADGAVTSAHLSEPFGAPEDFATYYENLVRGWRFEPYLDHGKPAPYCGVYKLAYQFP